MLLYIKTAHGLATTVLSLQLLATTLTAMLVYWKAVDGRTRRGPSLPLLDMVCPSIAKSRMVTPQQSPYYHYFK